MNITEGGLDDPRVMELLKLHTIRARAETAPGSAHALDVSGLKATCVRFWTAWVDGEPVGCGALKRLSGDHGEIKSMYTAEARRGRGIARALLRCIMDEARRDGRLSVTDYSRTLRPQCVTTGLHGSVRATRKPMMSLR